MFTTLMHPVPPHGPRDGARPAGALTVVRARHEWERANRVGLLVVHGFVGISAGLFILFTGSGNGFGSHDTWSRALTGTLALAGGVLLLSGLSRRPRVMAREVAGLVVLALWDLTMVAGFLGSALGAGALGISWPWQGGASAASEHLYPIALYLGLFVMMCVHLVTVRQIRQAEQRRRTTVRPSIGSRVTPSRG